MLLRIETALGRQQHLHAYGFPSEADIVSWLTKHHSQPCLYSPKRPGKPNHSCIQPPLLLGWPCDTVVDNDRRAQILHSGLGRRVGRAGESASIKLFFNKRVRNSWCSTLPYCSYLKYEHDAWSCSSHFVTMRP